MPDYEQDVQTILTMAIPLSVAHLGDMVNRFVDYATKTPPPSEQPTDKPRGIGLDVLTLLDARRVLALEAKKVAHKTGSLGKVEDAQIKFLQLLEEHAMFDSYFVFDRLPNLRFLHLKSHPARALAQLGGIAAVRPSSVEDAIKETKKFIGQKASGLTMLDVITRIVFEEPEVDPSVSGLFEVIEKNFAELNNCVLWFIVEGHVEELTLEQVRNAVMECIAVGGQSGKNLLNAHNTLRSLRNKRTNADSEAVHQAELNYGAAKTAYLAAVRAGVVVKDRGDSDESEMELGGGSKPSP
jgi:hypothetical protein